VKAEIKQDLNRNKQLLKYF